MDELFGVSMTIIAFVCAALTAIILMVVGYLAWRNPVMFKNGIRNIPRRRSQTALIVVGLMLSTVIITAAFSIGDTLTHSVTSSAYSTLGPVDETVTWDTKTHPAPQTEQTIPLAEVAQWRQTLEGDAKAVVPFLAQRMPVLDLRTRLNQPNPQVVAAAADALAPLGGLRDTDGKQASLRPGNIALDQQLAGKLDARVGDAVRLFYKGKQVDLTVSAIVPDTMLGGASSPSSLQGAAVNFDFLAGLTGDQGKANLVAISNDGSTRGGISATPTVKDALGPVLAGTPYQLNTVKKDSVDTAARLGSIFTTLFLVIGMFSIAAGILLIFLIFVMLAAERRPEMGMARAVGARRSQIVQSFLAEGMGYDLGSAVVGLGLGVGVAAAMTLFVRLAARGNLGGLDLTFTVAARSLVTAFCLGVIVTFIVVFFASWRASRMNITAAIRELPDVRRTNPEEATLRGYLRGALNAFASFGVIIVSVLAAIHFRAVFPVFVLAAVAALPGFWLAMLRSQNFGASAKERKDGEGVPRWPLLLGVVAAPIGIGLVVLLTYGLSLLLVRYIRERRPAQISTPLLIGGVLFAPLGLVLAALQDRRQQVAWGAGIGAVSLVLGALMTQWGLQAKEEWLFATGVSLLVFWAAATLRHFHIHERLSFTATSAALLVFWYLIGSNSLEWLTGNLKAGPEMLFFSGITMVIAGTFLIVYNAGLVLPLVARFGNRFGRILPAVKTAIAYPLTSRFKTGVTVAMIALIMFIASMLAAFSSNMTKEFNNNASKGGYDVRVEVNANNTMAGGLVSNLNAAQPPADTSKIESAAENRTADSSEVSIRDPRNPNPAWKHYTLIGGDASFFSGNHLSLQHRAAGYDSDQAVWQALDSGHDLAVIPSNSALGGGPGTIDDPLKLPSSYTKDGFQPFQLLVHDSAGKTVELTVIGQMKDSSLPFWPGIVMSDATLATLYPQAEDQSFFVRLAAGVDAKAYSKAIESSMVSLSADSMDQVLSGTTARMRTFLSVFEGFLALGLIVGIAALGVTASRSVVERRQQIGMLRAIGYQRHMVELSFLFESGFIALTGIGLGLVLGLTLAWSLFTSGALGSAASDVTFSVPWAEVGAVTGFALVASLIMAWLPARAASRVPIAEALRYE